jgi:hypothetical protein
MWSTMRMPTIFAASTRRRVMSRSSLLGVGSPEGARCAKITLAALSVYRFPEHDGRVYGAGVEQAAAHSCGMPMGLFFVESRITKNDSWLSPPVAAVMTGRMKR